MAEAITLDQVSKVYPGGNVALEDFSLDVEPGTFLVLLGPSGSGKTTLLRCLAGIERISSGSIEIGDRPVANENVHVPPERRNLSMVFQDYALWPHLVARDNVAFALRRRGLTKPARRAQASSMLARVGLSALADRYPSELSGGEQQRVGLARALVGEAGLVLCDEPLSNLDADLRERMRIEISALVRASGATTIYITHDQAEAFALADQVGVLDRGRLVQFGRPEEIYASPATPFVARFTGLAGELPVRIGKAGPGGTVEVEPTDQTLHRVLHAQPVLTSGTAAVDGLLTIRPTAVRISAGDLGDHHLQGTVADVAFRDRGYEHAVDVSAGTRINGVFDERRFDRGQTVGLSFDPSGCRVFA
ncbi:MAG TPA: ABC transporter ATP-binding protein [Gaiellaceae bacterium]|nr:ABC transporter ATP-binding protein [Gaiellaceae bacterium]